MLMIIAVAGAFVTPAVQSGWAAREIRQSTRMIAASMRVLRERAVRRGTNQEIVFETDGQTVQWSDGEPVTLPERVHISGVRGGWRDGDGTMRVIFYPNGSATGAALLVGGETPDTLHFAIEVDALLGSVVIRDVTS